MSDSRENFLSGIKTLIAPLSALQQRAALASEPTVEHIIHSGSHDAQQIELTLDRLLDCAGHPDGLALFKTLCRYYVKLNPVTTAQYVQYYREMWDSDDDVEQGVEL